MIRNRDNDAPLTRKLANLSLTSLIPGLPDDLACVVLACLPLWMHSHLKGVCRSWRANLGGKTIMELRQKLGKTEEFLCLFRDDPALCKGELFDPRAKVWGTFPPMPCNPHRYHLSNFECVAAGQFLFVLGGSIFDSRSYPMDKPVASRAVFRYDPGRAEWTQCSDMRVARGSFACGYHHGRVIVAGGGDRHAQFQVGGDRISDAEVYCVEEDRWEPVQGLPRIRAGCTGFFVGDEFWVVGGYGQPSTISGTIPIDEYYSDGEVLNVKSGNWRTLEPMWDDGERSRLGKVAVLYGDGPMEAPGIFMVENSKLLRYNAIANRWFPESGLPRSLSSESLCRVVALDGEIYVISGGRYVDRASPNGCKLRQQQQQQHLQLRGSSSHDVRRRTIYFQVYHPGKRSWRFISTKPPLNHSQDPPWGAMCVMKL